MKTAKHAGAAPVAEASAFHLDAIGGVAGDMFIAAVLDAFPDHAAGTLAAIRAVAGTQGGSGRVIAHRDAILTGSRFEVSSPPVGRRGARSLVGAPAHGHARFVDIRARIEACPLADEVKGHAIGIFTLLAQAEAHVHGVPIDDVGFHEVGAWDSIADVVGAAQLIAALGPATWTVGALPQGSGRVKTDHGWLPVPAPATVRLLTGFEFVDDGVAGERVTPTGAAILRYLAAGAAATPQRGRLLGSGYGFGTRTLPGLSNVLRLLAFAPVAPQTDRDQVAEIRFEIDDQSPEDLALGLDRLRANSAVLDVLQMPAYGKKGRIVAHVRILAVPEGLDAVIAECFSETTTLGLRWQRVDRRILPRTQATVDVDGRQVEVKIAARPRGATCKAECEDLRDAKLARGGREALRRRAEAAAAPRTPAKKR